MNNNINYLKLIKRLVKYMKDNYEDENYHFEEISRWYDICYESGEVPCGGRYIYGIITNEKPISSLTCRMIEQYGDAKTEKDKRIAHDYLIDNHVIYCYFVNDTKTDIIYYTYSKIYKYFKSKPHIDSNYCIDADNATKSFKVIDEEILNRVISNIESDSLIMKLFK